MTDITGGCLCGAVRYRIAAEPFMVRVCWCTTCQKLAAGNGSVNLAFPAAAVQFEGVLTDYASRADSGNLIHRRFCPVCGTPVFSAAEVRPEVLVVRAGTLDDPNLARPRMNIWTDSAPEWACLDPSLPSSPKHSPLPLPPAAP